MKSIAILLTIVALCYGSEEECHGTSAKAVIAKCLTDYGGDEALLTDWVQLKEANDDTNKCFRACVMTECKYFQDNGKLHEDVPKRVSRILHGGDENKIEPIEKAATKCLGILQFEENVCNNAESWSRCLIEQCENCGLSFYISD